jgi:rhodanese-related sulfurtransferase
MRDGVLVDLRSSAAYRQAHVDGAIWGIRPRLERVARLGKPIALMADTRDKARLAALDLLAAGAKDVRIVDGDLAACRAAGLPAVATAHIPADADRIDFLFFVHDRHEGNKAAMRGYLQWETGLLAQLDDEERGSFRLPAASH